jgi:DNA-binding IscR family transcriptional regulator
MILRLTEGTLAPVSCLEDEVNECPRNEICPTLFVWEALYKAITDTVDHITLQDILDNKRKLDGIDDYVI